MKNLFTFYMIYVGVGIILFSSSCKKSDWYEIKSDKSLAVPTTLIDMQALLDNTFIMNQISVAMGEIASDGHHITGQKFLTITAVEQNAYAWKHDLPYNQVFDWSYDNKYGAYPRVFYSNLVLEGLQKIELKNEKEKEQWMSCKGQALFQRARSFYELSQVYAPPYKNTTAETEMSIPLRLESNVNIPSRRSTVKQTYDQVISDLLIAKELLPVIPLYKSRASKGAALGLLSRVFLSMEDYAKARIYADSCLMLNNTLMDYNNLDTLTNQPIEMFNSEVIFDTRMGGYSVLGSSSNFIDSSLYTLYDSNDIRKSVFFKNNIVTGNITFRGNYAGATSTLFAGIATDEIYLIRAECLAREGNAGAAMEDLNRLLRKRWKVGFFTDLVAIDATDALKKILTERRKELLLRGLRWSDLRRLNIDERFKVTIERNIGGTVYKLEPNSFKYTFPIPDDIIQITGMKQNKGW